MAIEIVKPAPQPKDEVAETGVEIEVALVRIAKCLRQELDFISQRMTKGHTAKEFYARQKDGGAALKALIAKLEEAHTLIGLE